MVTELIGKYVWLLQKVAGASPEGLSFREISSMWESRFGEAYSRRTFCNHREAVAEVFGIEILCRRSDNNYYIAESSLEQFDSDSSIRWLLNTFTVGNLLSEGRVELRGRIAVEDIPSGYRHLTDIMKAMLSRKVLLITYRKYDSDTPETIHVQPWAVKEFASRWYVTGFTAERGASRIYGLDRITELKVTEDSFSMPQDYNVEDVFAASYGPYLTGGEPVLIRFRATPTEARYLTDLPIHPSQTLEEVTPEGSIFSLYLVPNVNLVMEFCRHGDRLEVLSPASLRAEVRDALSRSLKQYE